MKKLIVLLIIAFFIPSGCTSKKVSSNKVIDNTLIEEARVKNVKIIKDEAIKMLESMTLDEKLGQMFIIGFDGIEVDDNIKKMIQQNHIGGVIFFDRNITDSKQLSTLIADLKSINNANKIPLFISVDEEGGRVSRTPSDVKKFPSSRALGTKNDPHLSFKNGQDIGCVLSSLGFNMNFAPVLDILSSPNNTVIGDRSFGSTPSIVSSLGIETMKGLQSKNIISVIKHFPGHGDTKEDSHFNLPIVYHDKKRLDNFELIPFREAIKNGADIIMTAHIKLPALDNINPATLSKKVLDEILRKELGFDGVIITDDMEMDAISKNFGTGESVVEAITAGADIILMCHSIHKQEEALAALREAVQNGHINLERIDQSAERIIRLKQKYISSGA